MVMKKPGAWMWVFLGLWSCAAPEPETKNVLDERGKMVEGVSRNYFENGKLRNEVPVKDGKRNGEAREYYENGQLAASIVYESDQKSGLSRWYYQDGILFQEVSFVANQKHGIEKKYYNTGELMASLPWKHGATTSGLKEYQKNGKLVKQPEITVSGHGTLTLRLSNGAEQVSFYMGDMAADEPLDESKHQLIPSQKGVAMLKAPSEATTFIAVRKSNMKNPQILLHNWKP
jgi:hypothetical protein